MVPSSVEIFLLDVELAMGGVHISAFIVVRATRHHSNELFLPASLLIHVSSREEVADFRVRKHKLIEFVDDGPNSCLSSQFVEQSCHRNWNEYKSNFDLAN